MAVWRRAGFCDPNATRLEDLEQDAMKAGIREEESRVKPLMEWGSVCWPPQLVEFEARVWSPGEERNVDTVVIWSNKRHAIMGDMCMIRSENTPCLPIYHSPIVTKVHSFTPTATLPFPATTHFPLPPPPYGKLTTSSLRIVITLLTPATYVEF